MPPLLLLLLASSSANFLADPICPQATPLSPAQCTGQRSTCWSPGVRDTDCPGHGLCCYDGCANTCVSERQPQPSVQRPAYSPPPPVVPPPQEYLPLPPAPVHVPPPVYNPPPVHNPPPVNNPPPAVEEYLPPPAPVVYEPPPQPTPRPVEVYVPPPAPQEYLPPLAPVVYEPPPQPTPRPVEVYVPPPAPQEYLPPLAPVVYEPPPQPTPQPSPSHPSPSLSCPPASPLSFSQCQGRLSTCWSVGVPDLDCPNWGLCCFDGCANTCLGNSPPPPPPEPKYEPEPPRNPCDPSPCHRTAMCIPQEGRAMCKCRRGLEGDRPEPHPLIQCREPPRDPCNPSPCGVVYPGTTTCTPNVDGNPICRCLAGLIPKPDTIAGCGPECVVDPDCQFGYVCSNQRCVERPDPCVPNPCGPGALPINQGDSCSCECPTGTVGDPYEACHRGECIVDEDCSLATACQQYQCVDPCATGTCRTADFCRVMVHRPICGFNEQATPAPKEDPFVIGERYQPGQPLEPDSSVVLGERYQPGQPIQCSGGCGQEEPRMMMMMMDTSNLPVIGISHNRRRNSVRRRRRQRVIEI